jgi:hypothetical protein
MECGLLAPPHVFEALMKRAAENDFETRLESERDRRIQAETFTPHAVMNEAERLMREAGVFSVLFHLSYRVAITRKNDNLWAGSLAEGYAHLAERAKEDEGG